MPPLIQAIIGTTRPSRFSENVAGWLTHRLADRTDIDFEIVDLRDHPIPFFEEKVAPARSPRNYANESVAHLGRLVDRADGYIIVTAEYNHGYPAVLKNALDHLFAEFNRKPVAFVGYGNVGGARAIEQLRQVVVELEMAPLRHAVHILPHVMIEVMQADEFLPAMFSPLDERLDLLVRDLVWWAAALAAARNEFPLEG